MTSPRKNVCSYLTSLFSSNNASEKKDESEKRRKIYEATVQGNLDAIRGLTITQFALEVLDDKSNGVFLLDVATKYKHQHILDYFYQKLSQPEFITTTYSILGWKVLTVVTEQGCSVLQHPTELKIADKETLSIRFGLATAYNQESIVNEILETVQKRGKDFALEFLRSQTFHLLTPLDVACRAGHEKIVEKIMNIYSTLDMFSHPRKGMIFLRKCSEALLRAIEHGSLPVVKLLVEKYNVDINFCEINPDSRNNALKRAAIRGHDDVIAYLNNVAQRAKVAEQKPNSNGLFAKADSQAVPVEAPEASTPKP